MSRDDADPFRIRPGRTRARDGRTARRSLSFMQEVKRAVAKQGGDPRRLFREGGRAGSRSRSGDGREGGGRAQRSGRFNARGRGAKVAALRRAGVVERMNADNWIIPKDFEQRAAAYDAKRRCILSVRVLSAFDLEAQISSDGATWLDRQLVGRERAEPVAGGFGHEVIAAKRRRVQVLIAQGFAEREGENRIRVRRDLLATLERRELTRVGQELAEKRNTPFRPANEGDRIYGTFKETVQLASGKYALIENAHEFTLVPWRPVIERQLGREVAGVIRGNDVSWEFGRKRDLGISM